MSSSRLLAVSSVFLLCAATLILPLARTQAIPGSAQNTPFLPLQRWKSAIETEDTLAQKVLYSSNPPAKIQTAAGDNNADAEIAFWNGLKVRGLNLQMLQSFSPNPGMQQVVFQAEVKSTAAKRTLYISEEQLWVQQGGRWRIAAAKRTDLTRLQQPVTTSKDLYPAGVDANAAIKAALHRAVKEHKRVLVVFGANWCYDCHVLDLAFHRPDLAPLLAENYEVVHVDVGEGDKNQDLMKLYQVPMEKGIPGIAVLDGDGKLLHSQSNGEFERARALAPEDLAQFLNRWRPAKR